MAKLQKVDMNPKVLESGKLYIWSLPYGEDKVVWLSEDRTALVAHNDFSEDGEFWFFDCNLSGSLFGPFELTNQPVERDRS